ncbi:MAG TPA: OmpA family protein [Bacteroidales bacterium]|nr:OmpA family protein [Bacteroidales bacterium]HOE04753.1 OmpA family protein [Bacteroidales bacterium]
MKKRIIVPLAVVAMLVVVFSCVPARKFEEVKTAKDQCEKERTDLMGENERLTTSNNELQSEMERIKLAISALERDTAIKGNAYRTLTGQYDKINQLYEQLLENQSKLREGADAETQKALRMLQETRDELQKKEDELKALEAQLNKERANLEALRAQLEVKEREIEAKNKKVSELQAILDRQDSVMNALREKVNNALLGFQGDGLTVTMKDGKVYVSLDEKLLFKSGKWEVDPKGKNALIELAKVLEKNKDINIMIEGHTDNLAYAGNGNIADNWDLSVKRATAIVKILLENSSIDPTRLTAAGRGQYLPVDNANTPEARAKNRRTEIILTPKLDDLYNLFH